MNQKYLAYGGFGLIIVLFVAGIVFFPQGQTGITGNLVLGNSFSKGQLKIIPGFTFDTYAVNVEMQIGRRTNAETPSQLNINQITYDVDATDFASIIKPGIRINASDKKNAAFVEYVILRQPTSPFTIKGAFLLQKWVGGSAGSKADATNYYCSQTVMGGACQTPSMRIPTVTEIQVKTCNEQGAGTDADIYLRGTPGSDTGSSSSTKIWLNNNGPDDFEQNANDYFYVDGEVSYTPNADGTYYIVVGGKNFNTEHNPWSVCKVIVKNLNTGKTLTCPTTKLSFSHATEERMLTGCTLA